MIWVKSQRQRNQEASYADVPWSVAHHFQQDRVTRKINARVASKKFSKTGILLWHYTNKN